MSTNEQNWGEALFKRYLAAWGYSDVEYEPEWLNPPKKPDFLIKTAWGEVTSAYWQDRVIRETPMRRWGDPADVAAVARFLVSPEAAFVTGQVLRVNGGAVR